MFPDFEDERFRAFCEGCAENRKKFSTITVSACRTLLAAAALTGRGGVGYQEVADATGLSYVQAAHHIEQLSTGRAGQEGFGLLTREGHHIQSVSLSEAGTAFVKAFLPKFDTEPSAETLAAAVKSGPLPAFDIACRELPGITLGSFTVLLFIAKDQPLFGFKGSPAKIIAHELKIGNFPRHLALLSGGGQGRAGFGLLQLTPSPEDRRVRLPELTHKGVVLVSLLTEAIIGRSPEPPKRVKREVIEQLDNPDQVATLPEDAFEAIVLPTVPPDAGDKKA